MSSAQMKRTDWRGIRGVIVVADTVKPTSAEAISQLKQIGLTPVLLTGDNEAVARQIAAEVGIDQVIAEVLPQDKVDVIARLQGEGKTVAMVGDGVNDAPAMARADVGIAMGAAGSTVALETCDIALMSDDLGRVPFAVRLSRATSRIIRQNLIASLAIVAFLVIATFIGLNIGAVVLIHEGSTLIVVGNALRLLNFERGKEHHGIDHEDRPTA